LATDGVDARRLRIPAPAHSRYVEPIAARFEQQVAALAPRPPRIPLLSEITGKQLTADEVTSAVYWRQHLRHTVRFGDALEVLFADPNRVIVEVGPGQALTGIVRRHPHRPAEVTAVPTMTHPEEDRSDLAALLAAVGQLWSAGVEIDWPVVHRSQPGRRRVPLPTYPFQRRRYAIDPPSFGDFTTPAPTGSLESDEPASPSLVARSAAVADPTDVAARVAAVFRQLLGVSQFRPDDSLFSLGGDSIIAAQMVRLLREAFDIPLPLRAVFQHPTVAGLARHIENQLATSRPMEDTP
jgi:acyl transferase domain-containing protein